MPLTIRSKAKEKDGSLAENPCQLPNDPAQEKSMVGNILQKRTHNQRSNK